VRPTWLIAQKELRVQARRRSLVIIGFVAPLALAFAMNLVFGGIDDPDAPVTFDVAYVDLDGGDAAAGFGDMLDSIAEIGLLDLQVLDDEEAARQAVDDGDVAAAWVVPDGFSEAVANAAPTEITVIADVDSPTTASVARSIAEGYATRVGTGTLAGLVAFDTGAADPDEMGEIAAEVAESEPLLALVASESTATMLEVGTTLMAGMALFFAFFTAGMPLLGLIEERANATMARLLVAPIPEAAIVAGKTCAALVLGSVSIVALILASSVLMGTEWGPLAGAIPLSLGAVVAVTGIMSIAGAAARDIETAGNIQAIVAIVLAMLGGAFVPIPTSDGVLGLLSKLTPHGWYFDGLEALNADDTTTALTATLVLVGIGLVTLAIGASLARKALRR
jgi:ABC-2 type transport system permease protein